MIYQIGRPEEEACNKLYSALGAGLTQLIEDVTPQHSETPKHSEPWINYWTETYTYPAHGIVTVSWYVHHTADSDKNFIRGFVDVGASPAQKGGQISLALESNLATLMKGL